MRFWFFMAAGCFAIACTTDGIETVVDAAADIPVQETLAEVEVWVGPPAPEYRELVQLVDPMIGTDGSGNSVPGPQVPHGVVKLSPDSVQEVGLMEYEWEENGRLFGFSHTHLQGPGGSGYGYNQLLVLPVVDRRGDVEGDFSSAFDHQTESASPGYYGVTLEDSGVEAELTATQLAGLHRYTFPASSEAEIRLDLSHTGGKCVAAKLTFEPPNRLSGEATYHVFPLYANWLVDDWGITGVRTIYFQAEFSEPYVYHDTWTEEGHMADSMSAEGEVVGAIAGFTASPDASVLFKLGLSFISPEQATANLEAEIPGWGFEAVVAQAENLWNLALNQIIVDGPGDDLEVFYSALYRTMFEPVDYTEGDRAWVGPGGPGKVVELSGSRFYADDWCLWDTFRTSHPLRTLVEPDMCADVATSFLHIYDQGGWLPKCPWQATGYSRMMIGNHSIPVLADFIMKGLDGFDVAKAYEAMKKSQTEDSVDPKDWPGMCGYVNLGTPAEYLSKGFVSQDCDETQSVSMTLEYAFDDWCLAQVADKLGLVGDAAVFNKRAGNYVNHWDEETGFLRPRMKNGSWLTPFDPLAEDGFCEADAWKYLWFVPHDVNGLVALIGGDKAFASRLDEFFAGGHYTSDNQPDFHVPYLYNYVGKAWRTQELVTGYVRSEFGAGPKGLPGNDDAGSTSAWYLFGAMGFYPVAPASGRYQLTSPIFDRVALRLDELHHGGEAFIIEAIDRSEENIYIQSAALNGEPHNRTWLAHEEMVRGGTLTLQMGPAPGGWPAL
jgi:predicted alpha-1,2-mannosidase